MTDLFTLKVAGYDDTLRLIASDWPTHIVSVIRRQMPDVTVRHLRVPIDDITRPTCDMVLPQMAHLHTILDFTKDVGVTDRVLVHCQSGINRSTAAAIAILIQHGVAYDVAYQMVAKLRPHLVPNRLLIAYIDQHFALGGKLARLSIQPSARPVRRASRFP